LNCKIQTIACALILAVTEAVRSVASSSRTFGPGANNWSSNFRQEICQIFSLICDLSVSR